MSDIEFLICLVAAVALLVALARVLDVPYPIVLVLGGLGLGALPGVPSIELGPEVVFLVFVPPLVHAAGYQASIRRLQRDARPIALAAVVLVALTIVAVALAAHALVDGMPWAAAFVLAACVAPTDLVAATAVFRRLGAPERVVNLVEGENLVNDATALTAWRIAVIGAVAGTIGAGDIVSELLLVAGGGTVLGWAGGWAVAWLRRRVDDALLEVTITLLVPYVLFVIAEELGLSGILAAVVSGLYLGARDHSLTSSSTRIQAFGVWNVLVFLLESLLFVLVGLQFPDVLDALGDRSTGELLVAGGLIAVLAMAVRLVHHFTVLELDERLGGREPIPARERLVVGWAGMRGAISLAIALAIPLQTDSGAPFPERDAIIFLTLVVIVVTLVVQGLTLPSLIRRLAFEAEEPDARRQAMARFRTIEAALERVASLRPEEDGVDAATIERARSLYAQRANQLAGECRDGVPIPESDTGAWLRLRLELLAAERERLVALRDEGEITNQLMNAVQGDLDLEESRIERRLATG